MIRAKCFGFIPVVVLAVGMSTSSAASISSEFTSALINVQEFSSEHTDFGRYELILGKLAYQYPSSPEEVEGFRAETSEIFEGRIDRKVLDLGAGVGTLKAMAAIKSVVDDEGFKLVFSCEHISCGSVKGWGVFYPEQEDGAQSDQYYISAVYPENGPPERVMSAHISMVGDRVRVTIDEVALLVDIERSIYNYANAIMNYWSKEGFEQGLRVSGYGLGSSELSSTMKLKYKAVAELINRDPRVSVKLLGYTDYIGDKGFNMNLSLVRARTVAEFLGDLGVPKQTLDFEGLGIFDYGSAEGLDTVAPEHRMVMVLVAPTTEISGLN
ncbi:OmpA family protein [Marinobacter daqiaonensis]|uniref:OmpA family protein n=1 Tax=Marinobacter daqiaonensis TaxID=650891 RepID=A0A1I6I7J3_9GAMM|nr:OmpA family protein [Marinobacter daqiaonensis]SFR62673.1 OmpA family protein [Marinobacter daqiaonensis]